MDYVVGQKFITRLSRKIYTITAINRERMEVTLETKHSQTCLFFSTITQLIKDDTFEVIPHHRVKVTTTRKEI